MPIIRIALLAVLMQLAIVSQAFAGDFDWLKQLTIQAQADPSGFVAKLSTRFRIGDAEVRTVISNVGSQANAYMVLRLAEMSHHSVDYVTRVYRRDHHRGWGAMAHELGIKPGSRAFHALKNGSDVADVMPERDHHGRGEGHGHGYEHGHGNGRGHGRGHHGRGDDD